MNHSLDFVEIVSPNGLVQGISAAIRSLGGYDPQELIGLNYQDIVHPDDRERAGKAFARALRERQPETVKLRYRAKGGSWRKILACMQSYRGDTAIHAVLVMTRDLTEQSDVEESLVVANCRIKDLSEQLAAAADTHRKYLAAELHDDVQQILVGLRMSMGACRNTPSGYLPNNALVEEWIGQVQMTIDHLHELTVGLRKPALDDQALPGAVRSYMEKLPMAPNQEVMVETDGKIGSLAPEVALACFRIVQEGLANAVQHSGATRLVVSLLSAADRLTVSIQDDGVGFDVLETRARALDAGSVDLSSMRERAQLAGGRFKIRSSVGHGTSIHASFPL